MDQAHHTRMSYLEYPKDPFWAHFFSNLYDLTHLLPQMAVTLFST